MTDTDSQNPATQLDVSGTCDECGGDLPSGAHFCPACETATDPPPRDDSISTYGTIATAVLIGALGLILIPATFLIWDATFSTSDLGSGGDAALILIALLATLGAIGAIAADVAFVVHLSRPAGRDWRWWTQFFIVPMWTLAALAAIIVAIDF